MTYQNDFTLSAALLEQLTTTGTDAIPDLFRVLPSAAMQTERQNHLVPVPGKALYSSSTSRSVCSLLRRIECVHQDCSISPVGSRGRFCRGPAH